MPLELPQHLLRRALEDLVPCEGQLHGLTGLLNNWAMMLTFSLPDLSSFRLLTCFLLVCGKFRFNDRRWLPTAPPTRTTLSKGHLGDNTARSFPWHQRQPGQRGPRRIYAGDFDAERMPRYGTLMPQNRGSLRWNPYRD